MSKTTDAVIAQLTENTGRHMLDSGGAYGRHWERNQGKDFQAEPTVTVQWNCWNDTLEMMATVSLYHWMVHNLELDERLQHMFETYTELNPDMSWFELADGFVDELVKTAGFSRSDESYNTYNDPDHCDLSQEIQYINLNDEGEEAYYPTHVVLMVHGGCDVRGGYSSPRIYRCAQEDYEFRETMTVDSIWCNGSEVDTCTPSFKGFESLASPVHQYSWYSTGDWRSYEQNKQTMHETEIDLFKLPVQELADDEPATARDEFWIAVLDKRAYLMSPGHTALDNELHAGNSIG